MNSRKRDWTLLAGCEGLRHQRHRPGAPVERGSVSDRRAHQDHAHLADEPAGAKGAVRKRARSFVSRADGMGGHRAGEQASALAVVAIKQFTLDTFPSGSSSRSNPKPRPPTSDSDSAPSADYRIVAEPFEHAVLGGMGTTLTLTDQLAAGYVSSTSAMSRVRFRRRRVAPGSRMGTRSRRTWTAAVAPATCRSTSTRSAM